MEVGESGSGSRTRTYDPRINSPLLYRLSYAGVLRRGRKIAEGLRGGQQPRPDGIYSRSAVPSFACIESTESSLYSISRIASSPATMAVQRRGWGGRGRARAGER